MMQGTIKLGLMPPLTGLVGMYGPEISRAGQIACLEVNERGGVLGRPLELVIEDDGSLPESAVAAANRLVVQHKSVAIIGNLLSNSRIAVAYRVAEPKRIPYLNFSFYEGSIRSRYFFHFAAIPNQQIDRMIPYMRKHFGARMFFAGNNYEWPRGSIDAAKRGLAASGGTVVGEEYRPLGVPTEEIDLLLDQIAVSAPDVLVPYFAGDDQLRLLTRFAQRGLKPRMAVVMGHFDEVMASQLRPEVREGLFSSNTYFMTVDTLGNRDYLARLAAWPGIDGLWPDGNGFLTNFGEGAYLCVKAFAAAANRAGSLEGDALIESLATIELSGPQGSVQMDPVTHHARVNTYLTRCRADGSFAVIETFGAIDPQLPERYQHTGIPAELAADDEVRLQSRMLEQMTEAVLLIRSDDAAIVYANPGAERMFGYGRGELAGTSVLELTVERGHANGMLDQARRKGVWEGEVRCIRKDGRCFWTSATMSTFTHPLHGEVWMVVHKDITQIKSLQDELKRVVSRLDLATRSGSIGVWECDVQTGSLLWDDQMLRLYGVTADRFAGSIDVWREAVHPDDQTRTESALRDALDGIRPFDCEFRIVRPDGAVRAIKAAAMVTPDEAGRPMRLTGVNWDITERVRAEKVKNEFISTVSHELRTPLTSIRGSLGLIAGGAAGELPARARQLIVIAHKNTERLIALVNDILDMEKIESGKLEFRIRAVDLSQLVRQAIEANAAYAQLYGVTVVASSPLPDLAFATDPDRLSQVLTNLLSNAAKFSPAGGTVEVRVAETPHGSLRLSVVDHGPGIPEDFRERIFEKFVQADSSDTRQRSGTGLGLYITKALVERMGGQVGYRVTPGGGATFDVDFPNVPSRSATDWRPDAQPGDPPSTRVLVCEDDQDVAQLLRLMLEHHGFLVDLAHSAAAAEAKAVKNVYDALTLDLKLPDRDGLCLIKSLRSRPETASLPIIVVSASADEQRAKLDGDAVGVIDWVQKPIDERHLTTILRRVIRNDDGRKRILHVEDDGDLVNVLSAVVAPFADVEPAHSLAEARHKLSAGRFDLVILDPELLDGSGFDLIPEIKRLSPFMPILIFSGRENGLASMESRCGAAQIAATLVKSQTSNDQLVKIVRSLLDGCLNAEVSPVPDRRGYLP